LYRFSLRINTINVPRNKRIVMLLASQRFRDCEYLVPRAFFEQAGIEIHTASTSLISKGRFGFLVQNQLLIEDIHAAEFDGIYFVGGAGSSEYLDNEKAKAVFQAFLDLNKPIAAICAAPRNFLHWGLLKNKKSTGFDSDGVFTQMANEAEAIPLVHEKVVIDGLILTANGPEASEESALAYIQLLNGAH
jgi:putative intracellular protease/amidase